MPEWLKLVVNAPFLAAVGGGLFTFLAVLVRAKADKKPREEIRLGEMEFITKADREYKIWVMGELQKCLQENQRLRVEASTKDKSIIDLTRQVATLELDAQRRRNERKRSSSNQRSGMAGSNEAAAGEAGYQSGDGSDFGDGVSGNEV